MNKPPCYLPDFANAPLADFTEPKIRHFTEAWYAELARLVQKEPTAYSTRAIRLYNAIRVPSLWSHAGRPMLLTVMANVHAKNDKLPEDRAQVYAEMVNAAIPKVGSNYCTNP
jgi:predicted NACHT family NTPase